MRIIQYDGQRFIVDATEMFAENGENLGNLALCSKALPPGLFNIAQVSFGYVPGLLLQTSVRALEIAQEFVRINWNAQRDKRAFVAGDRVGDVQRNKAGVVVASPANAALHVFAQFGGPTEQVYAGHLVLLPYHDEDEAV